MLHLLLILMAAVVIHGRPFNNPVLGEGDFSDPGVINVDKTYYLVTSSNNSLPEKFPIYQSTDLSSWKLTGYIFDEANIPRWSDGLKPFLAPRLYKIGVNYHVYFTATDAETGMLSIGVAVAPHPAGPYTVTDRPLLAEPKNDVHDPAIIDFKGEIYLIWVSKSSIKGRMLHTDGLSFYSAFSTELISNAQNPGTSLHGPVHIFMEDHFLIYTLRDNSGESLHAASSSYPIGPYGNRNVTFFDPSDMFEGIGHINLVNTKLVNGVIVYDAYRKNEVGPEFPRVVRMAPVLWNDLLEIHQALPEEPPPPKPQLNYVRFPLPPPEPQKHKPFWDFEQND